jgi:hypothetical protein
VANAVSPGGELPFDVQVGTPDSAGTALQAPFVVDADPVLFQAVHIGRANVEAGLSVAITETNRAVDDFQMGGFIHVKAIQEQFVFNRCAHQMLL